MVTTQGFNALLKLVEEPPQHLRFIFATTEPDKVHRHDPLAHPPLPVPADPAAAAARPTSPSSARRRASPSSRPRCRSSCAPARGSVRDSLSRARPADRRRRARRASPTRWPTGLLGYTARPLLDDVVDAFAAGDGAAVFGVVDKVDRDRPGPAPVRRGPARAGCATWSSSPRSPTPPATGLDRRPEDQGERLVAAGRPLRRAPSSAGPPTSSPPGSPRCAAPPPRGCCSS